MGIDDRECRNCGASDWTELVSADYPENRQERDRTVKTVYECKECGAQGRHFVHNDGGPDVHSGALRE